MPVGSGGVPLVAALDMARFLAKLTVYTQAHIGTHIGCIMALIRATAGNTRNLARRLGVDRVTIQQVRARRAWRHVLDAPVDAEKDPLQSVDARMSQPALVD